VPVVNRYYRPIITRIDMNRNFIAVSKKNFLDKKDLLNYCLISIIALICVAPYFFSFMKLPRTEGFDYSNIPLVLYARQLLSGECSYWFDKAALGIPWPIPHSMTHTPFMPLFGFLPIWTAVAINLYAHLLVMGIFVSRLCRKFALSHSLTTACTVTLMLAPALEYLYWSDAPSVFLTWCILPIIFYYTWELISEQNSYKVLSASIFLGASIGYTILNGHTGVFSTYLIGLVFFSLAWPKTLLNRFPYLTLAFFISLLVGADKLLSFANELKYFNLDSLRLHQPLYGGTSSLLWNTFIKPIFWPFGNNDAEGFQQLFELYIQKNKFSRTIGFGGIFAIMAIFLSPFYGRKFPAFRGLLVGFWSSMALLFLPMKMQPNMISASWTFRDPANIFGVFLAIATIKGIFLIEKQRKSILLRTLMAIQIAMIVIGSAPFIIGPLFINNSNFFTVADYHAAADIKRPTEYIALLSSALDSDGNKGGRSVVSAKIAYLMERDMLVSVGAVNNIAPLHGITDVSFLSKGVSLDAINHSQSIPYGQITGERLKHWRLKEGAGDWTIQDQSMISVLGIEAVVASLDDKILTTGLKKIGELKATGGNVLAIYRNEFPWPKAFFLPENLRGLVLSRKSECNTNAFICLNLKPLVDNFELGADPVSVKTRFNSDRLIFAERKNESDVIITTMFRPEWRSYSDDGRLLSVENWYGLLKIRIPPGVRQITLEYCPVLMKVAHWTSLIVIGTIIIFAIAQIWIGKMCIKIKMP